MNAMLLRHTLLFLEAFTVLPRCRHNFKDRLSLTFESKSSAAINKIGVVGNEVVDAVVTTCWLVV